MKYMPTSRARAAAAARAMREHLQEILACIAALERYASPNGCVVELVPRDRLRDLIARGEALQAQQQLASQPRPAA